MYLSAMPWENATDFFRRWAYTEAIILRGGDGVTVYLDVVVLLNFLVDGLLLMGANRLTGHPAGWRRCALAALLGGGYAGVCMLPGFRFLGGVFWRLLVLIAMAIIAYGWQLSAVRRGTVFVLLSMALGGMAMGMGNGSFLSLVLAAVGLVLLCALGIRLPLGTAKFQPVELIWRGQSVKLTALLDTGNTLRDPITGGSVLVVGMEVGHRLGISQDLIREPIQMLPRKPLPGARLIPYRAVGKPGGMLLLLRLDGVRLNGKSISPMVAFSPEEIGGAEGYQALAGGSV
ncbi:MAG: hypothetical protein E7447_01665 [Ruminococcaceae bacterium]|nr:hypothetical protein [Oscillospiraceae bacterium]